MEIESCQKKFVEDILLENGYVSRNEMLKQYISRLSAIIMTLREKYIIDTIQYKSKHIAGVRTWGDCIYIVKGRTDGTYTNEQYEAQTTFFKNSNKMSNEKFFTNDFK